MKKVYVLFLAILMILQCMPFVIFADNGIVRTDDTAVQPNIWYGDEVKFDVKAGTGSYTFMSYYQKPRCAYEASNHQVNTRGENAGQEIPQLLVMLDASSDYTWTPDGLYSFGSNNYEVMYCCDIQTPYNNGIYYRRMNLEDGNYYDVESAERIRGILTNSYPYITLEQMKSDLIAAGLPNADKLTRSDIIAGVQTAIWAYANGGEDEIFRDYVYFRTADFDSNPRWGGTLHNYNNEMRPIWWLEKTGIVIYPTYSHMAGQKYYSEEASAAGRRVDSLVEYLKTVEPRELPADQIVISDMKIVDFVPVFENANVYTTIVRLKLNSSGSGYNDSINLGIYVDDQLVETRKVNYGTDVYEFVVRASAGQKIKAVASGTQILPTGVYYYEAMGGRGESQSLVGMSGGPTNIYAEAEDTLNVIPVKADINLEKVTDTGAPLAGAGFDLYVTSASAPTLIGSYHTDAFGKLTIKDLLPGTYKLVETIVPAGYVPPLSPISFTVDNNGSVILHPSNNANYVNGNLVIRNDPFCSISVRKIWNDGGILANSRPASVTVHLLANGERTGMSAVLSAQNNWSASFSNLEYYRNGQKIYYYVEEDVPIGYKSYVNGSVENGFTITNVPQPLYTDIPVQKIWKDNDDSAGFRPESVTVALYVNGVDTTLRATLSAENNWSSMFVNLPAQVNGMFYFYTVKEIPVDGYDSRVTGNSTTGFKVINTYTPETTSVSGSKEWNDSDNVYGIRPKSITVHLLADGAVVQSKKVTAANNWSWNFDDLPKHIQGREINYSVSEEPVPGYMSEVNGYNIINTYVPEKTSVSVNKVWEDADNIDGIRPDYVVITLIADGQKTDKQIILSEANDWHGEFTDLDMYRNGDKILYTVEETVPEGYTSFITGTAESGYTVTNIHNPPKKISVSVNKSWQDENNKDGIRPDSITVKLYADGNDTGKIAYLSEANGWKADFTGLDETKAGIPIIYTVKEVTPNGYTSLVTGNASEGFLIVNTHIPEKVSISGTKSWDDNNDKAGKRPDSISVTLWANGKPIADKSVSAADGWAWSFSGMDAFENGMRINYSVTETPVDGYTTTYDGMNIINTLEEEEEKTIDIPVRKSWYDSDNSMDTRPASVTVELLANGISTGISMTLDAASGWSSSFEGLPIRDENGREIVYTIREIAVPGYVAEVSGNAEIGFAVLNIYEEVLDDEDIPRNPPPEEHLDDEDIPRSPFAGDGIIGLVLTCILSAGACKCFRHKKKDNSDEE